VANQDNPYYNRAMTETPEELEQHRQEILLRSSLLRTFLNPDASLDPSAWQVQLAYEYQAVEDEIIKIHGDNYLKYTASNALIVAASNEIYASHVTETQTIVLSRIMLAMGYEIENKEDLALVMHDTFSKFNDMGIWNAGESKEESSDPTILMETYTSILAMGMILRKNADVPQEFLEFFKNRS
jgi:hypothetical protein